MSKSSRSKARSHSKRSPRKNFPWVIVGAVTLAVLLIAVQLTSNRSAADTIPSLYSELPVHGTAIGNPDAPVTVVEYFDFQCPACQASSDQIVKPLLETYVREGKVRFIYNFFPILGPESVAAAQAAYCAMEQDAFWPYQHVLFAKRGTGNRGTYSRRNLVNMARDIGLDVDAFTACLDGPVAEAYVQASYDYAVRVGLRGTPSFFVNDRPVAISRQAIEQAIEEALAGAGGE